MLPASNRGAGMSMGFPDVCNTIVGPATVPLPYPNMAMNAQASGFSQYVQISGMNALNQGTQIPMTSGDEAGTAHPTIKGGSTYTMGNPIVFVDGMPAINLACPTTGNNMNDGLGAALVPSISTVTYCDASRDVASLAFAPAPWPWWARLAAHGLALRWAAETDGLGPTIGHVRRGSLGDRLGARAGDRLVVVQGRPVASLTSGEVLAALEAGAAGSLQIVVLRPGVAVPLELAGAGSAEDLRVVHAAMLPEAVGYLAVHAFTRELPALSRDGLDRLARAGARSLVLDLRGNPGGELAALLGLAGELVAAEPVIVRMRPHRSAVGAHDRGPELAHRAQGGAPKPWPLVVLVDRGSASAAELLAGALQCLGRAIVVGERTYGKGAALTVEVDPRTSELRHRARAEARLPNGAIVEAVGIQPDVEVPSERGVAGTPAEPFDQAIERAHLAARGLQQQAQR